jgi:hypothetical protein
VRSRLVRSVDDAKADYDTRVFVRFLVRPVVSALTFTDTTTTNVGRSEILFHTSEFLGRHWNALHD